MFFHLTDCESEFRRPLKVFWKTLESPLKNSILLFCTVAHIKEVCAVHNTVSFPKRVLLRKTVGFSLSVSGWPSPHPLLEVACIKVAPEDTYFGIVTGGEHRTHLSGSTCTREPCTSWTIHSFLPWCYESYLELSRRYWYPGNELTGNIQHPGCSGTYFMVLADVCGSVGGYWTLPSLLPWAAQSKLKQLLL